MKNSSPIFIGGLMKSGTSLFRKIIANHPNIFGGLETHWFNQDFISNYSDYTKERNLWLSKFYDIDSEKYIELAATSDEYRHFIDKLLTYCTQRVKKNRFLEKTPDNILHLDKIWSYWPKAQIIHVVRDPRDIYASWKINKKGNLNSFIKKVNQIQSTINNTNINATKYKIVNYNSLIENPANCLTQVFAFLGEKYYPRIANYAGDDSDYKKVLEITGKVSPTTKSLSKPMFSSSIDQWKKILNKKEIDTINLELEEYFMQFIAHNDEK